MLAAEIDARPWSGSRPKTVPASEMTISFYVPDEPNLEALARLDPDHDWQLMRRGQRWTLQTYLRMREADLPVRLVGEPPDGGILVYHAKHQDRLRQSLNGHRKTILLGIRGDKKECYLAHFEVVQNGCFGDDQRRFYVPYWPQPNLIPRNPLRGSQIESIAFKGFDVNLHPYFFSLQWKRWLADNGMQWVHHSMPHAPSEIYGVSVDWHDYREIDLVIGIRPPPQRGHDRRGHSHKPATKLYNAWHAGVPAILGEEYAYREVRRSELDYLEVSSPEEVHEAISRLRADPGLYRAMAENGLERASEFDRDLITERWCQMLVDDIPASLNGRSRPERSWMPHPLRYQWNRLRRVLAHRHAR